MKLLLNEYYKKIVNEVVDPGFNHLNIRRDKSDKQIIAYLSKPSRKKYKFLVGWFEGNNDDENQLIRDFSIEVNEKKRIFGIQGENIKMHIMSIRQYLRITHLHDPNQYVTSESAANYFKEDRLVFVIQYPSEKMYEMKGVYQNFSNIQPCLETFPVLVPDVPVYMPERIQQIPYMNQFNPLVPPPIKIP